MEQLRVHADPYPFRVYSGTSSYCKGDKEEGIYLSKSWDPELSGIETSLHQPGQISKEKLGKIQGPFRL